MTTKHRHITLLALAATLALASCVTDDSSEGGAALPTLTVEGSGAATMPVYNIYLGNELTLKPAITYSGADSLTCHWQVGTYANGTKGELHDAGYGPELRHNFTSGGSYYAHLTVTDGRVGKAADYQINVNRTFEEGYLLAATDADGGGNLTFLKILTPEEEAAGTGEVVMEHAMERMNEDVSERGLLGVVMAKDTYPTEITRLIASTPDRCYFLDPNELTIVSAGSYGEVYPGFTATNFYADSQTPFLYDSVTRRFVHINVKNQFPFQYRSYDDLKPDDIVQTQYSYWGSVMYNRYFLDYTHNHVAIYDAYAPYYGTDPFPTTGSLLDGQTLVTAFSETQPGSNYITPWYIISRNDSSVTLWKNSTFNGVAATDFAAQQIPRTADLAVPARGTWMKGSPTYNRMFYAIGGRVYVFLPANAFALPTLSQYAIQMPDGEEVTCMETNFSTEELYVATYNATTGRGSFYVYSCADVRTDNAASVKPKKSWKDCTGRVNSILYKPSIQ